MLKMKFIFLLLIVATLRCIAQESQTPTPQWRPVYHFTPPVNWTNDPNGLIVLNGVFQLYYQHNPFENKWGHMSWGHASSTNLLHWKNLPVAIPEQVSPDTVTSIFSGSAVWDKNNSSGFCKGNKGCLVAIFTGDQPKQKKESQFIAYSNDNGLTFSFYNKNPVIDLNKKDFRDPNVIWYEPAKKWIMTVSSLDDHKIRFYGSKNLRDWQLSGSFDSGVGRECPSMVQLAVNGDPQNKKWVLMVCSGGPRGPFMQYFVGNFDGSAFKSDYPESQTMTIDYGDSFYAAIPWHNAPGNRTILLGWLQPGKAGTFPWTGQMSIPRDLSLKTTAGGIRLFQNPSAIITDSLDKYSRGRIYHKKDFNIADKTVQLSSNTSFNKNANWIEAEFDITKAKIAGFNIAEKTDSKGNPIKKVIVGYNVEKQELFIDFGIAEREHKPAGNLFQTAPLTPVNGKVKMKILLDKSSLEVFGNDGERVISSMIYPDENATGISVFAKGAALVKDLKIWDLSQ